MIKAVIKRFAKGAIAAGLSAVGVQILATHNIPTNIEEFKQFILAICFAFITGFILAIEKAWNWQPAK